MTKLNHQTILFTLFLIFPFTMCNGQNYWKDLFAPSYGIGAPAQLGGGVSTLYQLHLPKPLVGMHLRFRVDNDTEQIFRKEFRTFTYVGVNYFFKQGKQKEGSFTALPKDTSLFDPISVPFKFKETVSYLAFDVGSEYYLYSNEKETFSFYAGWVIGANIPFYKGKYEISDYDQANFTLQTDTSWKENRSESKANFKAGVNMGATINVGTSSSIYIETSPFFDIPAEKGFPEGFTIDSRFFISFNLGYRYEF